MRTNTQEEALLVLVAGPYRSGTGDDPLPLIELAGSRRVGDEVFDEIFHPIARRLLALCDAVLRVGGASAGADEMVELARADGKLVVSSIGELPGA